MNNKVVEAYGGILWQKEADGVELIQAWTGCTKEDATEALKVWRRDKRVSSKPDDGTAQFLAFLRKQPLPKYEDFINMHELRALLARSDFQWKRSGGRPPVYDWVAVELALANECKLQESVPRRDHSASDWRTLADACRFVREEFSWADGGPSDSALKDRVRLMLDRIRAKAGN